MTAILAVKPNPPPPRQIRVRDPQNAPPPCWSSRLAELLTAQAYKHGVLISAGTDSFAPAEDPYPALQSEIEILVRKVGMTPMDAIRSATVISAMSMGQQTEMGTLDPGKLANIVFLSANPLEDLGAFRQVVLTPAVFTVRLSPSRFGSCGGGLLSAWPERGRCIGSAIFRSSC